MTQLQSYVQSTVMINWLHLYASLGDN